MVTPSRWCGSVLTIGSQGFCAAASSCFVSIDAGHIRLSARARAGAQNVSAAAIPKNIVAFSVVMLAGVIPFRDGQEGQDGTNLEPYRRPIAHIQPLPF